MALSYFVKPLPGERVESSVVLPTPDTSLLCGVVRSPGGDPAAGIPVLLYRDNDSEPAAQCCTDDHGVFCFASLPGDQLYRISIFQNDRPVRHLDIQL